MRSRRIRLVAWSAATLACAFSAASAPLIVANRDTWVLTYLGTMSGQILLTFTTILITALGLAIAIRHPENAIGWILLTQGLGFSFGQAASHYAIYALATAPGTVPGGTLALAIGRLFVQVVISIALIFEFLLFPTGRLPSSRWNPVLWASLIGATLFVVVSALRPGPFESPWDGVENPYALSGTLGTVATLLDPIAKVIALVLSALSAAAVVTRLRTARGVERQQLKLIAYAAALLAAYLPLYFIWISSPRLVEALSFLRVPMGALGVTLFSIIPIAAGVAILRYRLYDIDLLIKRTVVYGATSAAVAATFFLAIVALQPVLRPLTGGSEIAIAASTLVSFALFQPVRRRIQGVVDRRFDRARYDVARTLDQFADRLRDEVDLDALRSDLVSAVRGTMAPSHTSLWLRERVP